MTLEALMTIAMLCGHPPRQKDCQIELIQCVRAKIKSAKLVDKKSLEADFIAECRVTGEENE